MNSPEPLLLEEISLGSARGGKKPSLPVEIEVIRGLTAEDLPAIRNPPPVAAGVPVVRQLRSAHHQLAQLIAKGEDQATVALVTGYSQSYLSNLKTDPAFAELIEYYRTERELVFIDAMERLRAVGITAIEEMQARLEEAPEKFTKREIMELIELAIVKPTQGRSGGANAAPGPAVSLEVKFVQAGPRGPVFDAEAKLVKS